MSYSGAWTAIRGKASAEVLRELGLHVAEVADELPAVTGTELANGWYVITVDLRRADDPCAPVLAKLSSGCEVVACGAVESTMYSAAAEWKNGLQTWSVTFDPDESIRDLSIEGTPPAALESIRQPGKADIGSFFDAPLQLSKSITGFRPDEGSHEGYQVLVASITRDTTRDKGPKQSSWLKRLFQ
jgi:hypothetical protein